MFYLQGIGCTPGSWNTPKDVYYSSNYLRYKQLRHQVPWSQPSKVSIKCLQDQGLVPPSESRGRVKVDYLCVAWRWWHCLGVSFWCHTIWLWLLLGNIFLVEVRKCLPTYIIPDMKVVQVLHPHFPMIQTKVHPINLGLGSQSQRWIEMLEYGY